MVDTIAVNLAHIILNDNDIFSKANVPKCDDP